MSQSVGRSLISRPEAYFKSYKCCLASLEPGHPTLDCIVEYIATLISDYIAVLLEDPHSPFCILSVGSGDGSHDLAFAGMLSKIVSEKLNIGKFQFFQRSINQTKTVWKHFVLKQKICLKV